MKCAIVALIAVVALFAPTHARALSGTQLYQSCSEKKASLGDVACTAYVHGLIDGMLLGTLTQRSGAIKYCPPKDGLSVVQARLIVEKYMGEHPEDLHLEAGLSAAQALSDAFPCGAKSN